MAQKRVDKEGKHFSGSKAKLHTLQNDFATPQWAVDGDTPSEVYRKVVQQKLNQYFCQVGEKDKQQGRTALLHQNYMDDSNKNKQNNKQQYDQDEDYDYGYDKYDNHDEEEKAEDHESSNNRNSYWNRRGINQYSDDYIAQREQQQQKQRNYRNNGLRADEQQYQQYSDDQDDGQGVYDQQDYGDQEAEEDEDNFNEGELCYEDIVYRGDGSNKDSRNNTKNNEIHQKVAGKFNKSYEGLNETDGFGEQRRKNNNNSNNNMNSLQGRGIGVQNENTRKLYVNQLLEARQSRQDDYEQQQQQQERFSQKQSFDRRNKDEEYSYQDNKFIRNQQIKLGQQQQLQQYDGDDKGQEENYEYDEFDNQDGNYLKNNRNDISNQPKLQNNNEEERDYDGFNNNNNNKSNNLEVNWKEDSKEYANIIDNNYQLEQQEIQLQQQQQQQQKQNQQSISSSLQQLQAQSKLRQEGEHMLISYDLKSKSHKNSQQQQQQTQMSMHSHSQQQLSSMQLPQQTIQYQQSQQLLKQQRQQYPQDDEYHEANHPDKSSLEMQDSHGSSSISSNHNLKKSSMSSQSSQAVLQNQPNQLGIITIPSAQILSPTGITSPIPGDQTALISSLVQQLLVLQAQVSQQNATASLLPALQLQIAALMQNNPLLQLQQLQQQSISQQSQLLQQPQQSMQIQQQQQQQIIQQQPGFQQPPMPASQHPSDFSNHSSINSYMNHPSNLGNQQQQQYPSLPLPPLPEQQSQSQQSLSNNKLIQSPPVYAIPGIRSQEITPRVIRSTTESATPSASHRHTQDSQRIPLHQQQQYVQLSSENATPGRNNLNKKSANVSSQAKLSKIMDDILEKQEVTIKNLQKERSLSKIARESSEQSTMRDDLRASKDQALSKQLNQIQNTLHQEQQLNNVGSANGNNNFKATTNQRKKWNATTGNSNSMIVTADQGKAEKEVFKETKQQEITGFVDERAIEIDAIKQRFKNDMDSYLGYQEQTQINNNNNYNNRHSKEDNNNGQQLQQQQQVRQSKKWGAPASQEQPLNTISRNKTENAVNNVAGSDSTTPLKWEIDWKNQQEEQGRVKSFVQSEDKQGLQGKFTGKQMKYDHQEDKEIVDPKKSSQSGAGSFSKTAKSGDQREVQMKNQQNFLNNEKQQQYQQQLQYYQDDGYANQEEDSQRFNGAINTQNYQKNQSNASPNTSVQINQQKQQNTVVSAGVQFDVIVDKSNNNNGENVSLADAFRKKKGDLADKLEHQRIEKERQRTVENVREPRKTKEELLQIRKDLLHQGRKRTQKSSDRYGYEEINQINHINHQGIRGNFQQNEEQEDDRSKSSSRPLKENKRDKSEGKSVSKEPSAELLNRLIYGIKAKVDRKDYQKLTTKNYHQLPEIKKKNEDLKKKQEMAERIKQKKEYEQVCRKDLEFMWVDWVDKLRTKMRNIGSGTKSPNTGSVFNTEFNDNTNSINNNYQYQQLNQQQQQQQQYQYQQQQQLLFTLPNESRPRSSNSNPYVNYQEQQKNQQTFKYYDNNNNTNISNRTVPTIGNNNSNKNNINNNNNKFENYQQNDIISPQGQAPSKDQGYLLRQQYQQQQQQRQQPYKETNKLTKGNQFRNQEEDDDYENYSDIMY